MGSDGKATGYGLFSVASVSGPEIFLTLRSDHLPELQRTARTYLRSTTKHPIN